MMKIDEKIYELGHKTWWVYTSMWMMIDVQSYMVKIDDDDFEE